MSTLIDSLNYKKHPELEKYFDSSIFKAIKISKTDKKKIMLESGYVSNITMKFWRLLEVNNLLRDRDRSLSIENCDFLLEVFLNQALSCTDTLATCINYYMQLNLKKGNLAIQSDKFIEELRKKIPEFPEFLTLEHYHNWTKEKLFPYRNIVHHMGEPSGLVELSEDGKTIKSCLYPKPEEWDFVKMRKEMENYPSHTAMMIDMEMFNGPNLITGDRGDEDKYIKINIFFENWIEEIHKLIEVYVQGLVWYQKT